jgi:HEAT repeat protein
MGQETTAHNTEIEKLIHELVEGDSDSRPQARAALIEIGSPDVTRALVFELNDPRRDVRWEAAKALVSIADPIAAPALVLHLQDEDADIRWLAAEGLASLGEAGLLATLNAAIRNASNSDFCKAAHLAFKELKKYGYHSELLDPVIESCESTAPGVSLPVSAYKLLRQIKAGTTE